MSFNNTLSFVLVHEMNDGYSIHRSEYKKERPTDRFIGMKRTYFWSYHFCVRGSIVFAR